MSGLSQARLSQQACSLQAYLFPLSFPQPASMHLVSSHCLYWGGGGGSTAIGQTHRLQLFSSWITPAPILTKFYKGDVVRANSENYLLLSWKFIWLRLSYDHRQLWPNGRLELLSYTRGGEGWGGWGEGFLPTSVGGKLGKFLEPEAVLPSSKDLKLTHPNVFPSPYQ